MNFEAAKAWQGQVVDGKFPLHQWLGGSTQSAVFLTEMGSARAAIKLVAADTLDANLQLLRWQQASQLSHPHLLRLSTEGRCEIGGVRLLYVVMEYADETLSETLAQRALTGAETRDLLQSVLEALTHLHRGGFVHGRVKPANILAQGNQIKLSVDQIRASGEVGDGDRSASVYDAPELRIEMLSPSVDVWSLGVTLVEALTQHPVVPEPSLYKEVNVPGAMPEPFRSIARECLRRDPAQRCTIAEIRNRLKSITPVTGSTATVDGKGLRLRSLMPVAAILLPILLIALFVGPKLFSHREAASRETGKPEQPIPAPSPPPTSPPAANRASTKTISQGSVVRQVLPTVPQSARNTIQGKVRVGVRVEVDESGKITRAELASAGPSKYFARLALRAAEQWQFTPPQADGQPVPSAWLLRFQFGRTGAQVFPTQVRH